MVQIKSLNRNDAFVITLSREWRDHLEQIIIFLIFLIASVIGIIIQYFIQGWIQTHFYLWIIILLIGCFYYILPTRTCVINLNENQWIIRYRVFFIPYFTITGKLSDISKVVLVETHNYTKSAPKFVSPKRVLYRSSLEFWSFQNEDAERNQFPLFSRSSFSQTGHLREMKQNRIIALALVEFFKKFDIPIEFDFSKNIIK